MWPEIEQAKIENRHELVLSGKEIASKIAKNGLDLSVFTLEGLNFLNISGTELSAIPDDIGKLANLQTLVLHSNKLEHANENIAKLTKLKMLDLSRNLITSIPDGFADLPLTTLNLNVNRLESFPEFTKNSKLAVLDLSNNKLKLFPRVCSEELVNLSELKLHGNEIEEIPNNIHVLPLLKLLDISENKIKTLPGELAECHKLKDLNLKSNPVSDRRLLKLIDQCRTKQVLDYVKQNCPKTTNGDVASKGKSKKKNKSKNDDEEDDNSVADYKYSINVKSHNNNFKVIIKNGVKTVREHFAACVVNNVSFTEESFKKFIQLQNKLHDSVCEKRNVATIATHDFNKLPPGDLIYSTSQPSELMIKPLNRATVMSGAELFTKLQTEANNLRKEKKRSTYSGIHKFLYLIEGKPQYPCVINANKEVISFPPITNSDISKIEVTTTRMFIEVTSSLSPHSCKNVLNTLLKDMVLLFEKDLEVEQVKTVDEQEQLKVVYPSKTDLVFEKSVSIKTNRD
ncbi:leucine-rich repeat-containing protein 47-like [Diabrotica virgifera virgifera]|uniref:Leucine-rich repeat-containing protein 47-like n=1 Tax=Diabrotica virgifera virgifera TaxID=50390 RepID=A0A6P7FBV4_DIAVI|nr:leucine-rich repeat-containing protein 47-like [Diabrotica virgifera virgifera]